MSIHTNVLSEDADDYVWLFKFDTSWDAEKVFIVSPYDFERAKDRFALFMSEIKRTVYARNLMRYQVELISDE